MYDLIVVGGGPAGLAAACAAWDAGLRRILIVERDAHLGGILNQCIHNGFGLHYFKEELTGPEYAARFTALLRETGIEVRLETMVLAISPARVVTMVGAQSGYAELSARSIILAMGSRERTRGAISIAGTRPAGIYSAGTAQHYVNLEGYLPGKRVVILGSGDIGLIMARRMTLEGAKVLACVEVLPYSGGLTRNIVQCLDDFGIPLLLSHTVTQIVGTKRLERVVVAQVDAQRRPIAGTEQTFDCDTLLLSVGLVPENELTRQAGITLDARTNGAVVFENMETSLAGVFACGNVAHVHDLVDFVTDESQRAGAAAAKFVLAGEEKPSAAAAQVGEPVTGEQPQQGAGEPHASAEPTTILLLSAGDGISYTVPQHLRLDRVDKICDVFFRVTRVCKKSRIVVKCAGETLTCLPREHLAPGEMEHLVLTKAVLEKAHGTLELLIEEAVL